MEFEVACLAKVLFEPPKTVLCFWHLTTDAASEAPLTVAVIRLVVPENLIEPRNTSTNNMCGVRRLQIPKLMRDVE